MKQSAETLESNFLKYATAALLLVIPLYPKFPLFFLPGTQVAVRLEDFLILIVMSGWFVFQLRHRLPVLRRGLFWSVGLYFIALFISAAGGAILLKTVIPGQAFLQALRRVEYLMVLFLAADSIRRRETLTFYLKVIVVTALIIALYGIGQRYAGWPVISTMNSEFAQGVALTLGPEARINSTFAGHYDLSAYLILTLLTLIYVLLMVKKPRTVGLVFIIFLLSLWTLAGSGSRISYVAYLVAATGLLFWLRQWRWMIPVLGASLLVGIFSQSLSMRYSELLGVAIYDAYHRLVVNTKVVNTPGVSFLPMVPTSMPSAAPSAVAGGSTANSNSLSKVAAPSGSPAGRLKKSHPLPSPTPLPVIEDRSSSIRFNVEWPRAMRAFEKNPLMGTGPSSITLATDNDYLRTLGESGLLGFFTFTAVFLAIGTALLPTLKDKKRSPDTVFIWMVVFAAVGLLLNALFIDVFEASKVAISFWLLIGMAIGLAGYKTRGKP
jgi:hypothetical protein